MKNTNTQAQADICSALMEAADSQSRNSHADMVVVCRALAAGRRLDRGYIVARRNDSGVLTFLGEEEARLYAAGEVVERDPSTGAAALDILAAIVAAERICTVRKLRRCKAVAAFAAACGGELKRRKAAQGKISAANKAAADAQRAMCAAVQAGDKASLDNALAAYRNASAAAEAVRKAQKPALAGVGARALKLAYALWADAGRYFWEIDAESADPETLTGMAQAIATGAKVQAAALKAESEHRAAAKAAMEKERKAAAKSRKA